MPLYEYRCIACRQEFSSLLPMSRVDDAIPCPSCGAEDAERKLSVFAVIREGAVSVGGPAGVSGGGCACGGACACAARH